jgi:hypothetical protein
VRTEGRMHLGGEGGGVGSGCAWPRAGVRARDVAWGLGGRVKEQLTSELGRTRGAKALRRKTACDAAESASGGRARSATRSFTHYLNSFVNSASEEASVGRSAIHSFTH